MFTRAELAAHVRAADGRAVPRLAVLEYGPDDFDSPESEQVIRICTTTKVDCDGALRFWLAALRSEDWTGREDRFLLYTETGQCEPISRSEFAEHVRSYTASLVMPAPPRVLALDAFISGMAMYTDWNDLGLLADLGDSWLAFFWETTA